LLRKCTGEIRGSAIGKFCSSC